MCILFNTLSWNKQIKLQWPYNIIILFCILYRYHVCVTSYTAKQKTKWTKNIINVICFLINLKVMLIRFSWTIISRFKDIIKIILVK